MIPKYNEMYKEVLMILSKQSELTLPELTNEISNVLNLSLDDREKTFGDGKRTVVYNRLGWTKTYLAKAGLVESIRRGVFRITSEGKKVLNSNEEITNEYLMKYESFVEFITPNNNSIEEVNVEENNTPIENIDKSLKMISSRLSGELLEMILLKEPIFFERLVLDLLDKMGYAYDAESVTPTRYSSDEGIDGIIKEDKFGFSTIYVQAKRWSEKVGRPEIQKFLGAVTGQGGNKGLFITTSSFTKDAMEYAKKQLQVKLILIDGKILTDLMINYNLGVSVVKSYEIKQIDIDYFESDI